MRNALTSIAERAAANASRATTPAATDRKTIDRKTGNPVDPGMRSGLEMRSA
jgi:hypothetical protein